MPRRRLPEHCVPTARDKSKTFFCNKQLPPDEQFYLYVFIKKSSNKP